MTAEAKDFLRVKRVLASAVLVIISLLRKGENPQTHSAAAHIGVVMSCSLSTLTNLSLECTLRVIMKFRDFMQNNLTLAHVWHGKLVKLLRKSRPFQGTF